MSPQRTGGRLLADQLTRQGCQICFCVPGESYLPLLDGLHDHRERIRVITCRHESAAANAAEAYGKLTGRPGVCLVTRGPGATQAAVGVHTARQDSTPLILMVGQVARGHRGREAFQEIDCDRVFGSMAKAVFDVDDPDRLPEIVAAAFSIAASGRQGPVVISLPEDVLAAATDAADAPRAGAREPTADPGEIDQLRERLAAAERPLVLVGGGPWDDTACVQLAGWATSAHLPVAASFRRQDLVDNELACYVGDVGLGVNPKLARRIADSDLLLAIGPRLTETETQGYTLPSSPPAAPSLVHVHPDPVELGRVYQPGQAILSGMRSFAAALGQSVSVSGERWREWSAQARAEYEAWSTPAARPGAGVDLARVMQTLRAELPEDAIVCNGAGNYTVWIHRFLRYRRRATQLAPQSGAMGYGIPAAIAAQLLHPDRAVVALAGDGCFQMCAQELATIVQERLPILVIVANNRMLGTIRMHQERRFPGRVIATDLVNPDFAAYARSFGIHAERVEDADAFPAALARARATVGPALIEVLTDPEALTPAASLSQTREQALAAIRR
ncbi:MAG TPA: thiamine pyrophosphate-binding protein [Solirubrobacteraceae bacterium]|nr:thiamine pyrophosphate-binding protein [Solirubrobacteraceae bacterium]